MELSHLTNMELSLFTNIKLSLFTNIKLSLVTNIQDSPPPTSRAWAFSLQAFELLESQGFLARQTFKINTRMFRQTYQINTEMVLAVMFSQ